jgi:hypothetical protein
MNLKNARMPVNTQYSFHLVANLQVSLFALTAFKRGLEILALGFIKTKKVHIKDEL